MVSESEKCMDCHSLDSYTDLRCIATEAIATTTGKSSVLADGSSPDGAIDSWSFALASTYRRRSRKARGPNFQVAHQTHHEGAGQIPSHSSLMQIQHWPAPWKAGPTP